MFFCKEHNILLQRTQRTFAKNVKERKNFSFFCKRTQKIAFFFSIYIYKVKYLKIYIDIYLYI